MCAIVYLHQTMSLYYIEMKSILKHMHPLIKYLAIRKALEMVVLSKSQSSK